MALITCIECGKQFSDRAKSCPNCGCPTSVIRKELKERENTGPGRIIEEYDILGKTFAVSKAMRGSLIVSKGIIDVSETLAANVERAYWDQKGIDAVIKFFPSFMAEILDKMLDFAVQMLVKAGIYDLDKEGFYARHEQELDTSVLLTPIMDKYLEIMDLQDQIKEYHDYVEQSRRNVWRGGGFGVTGAVKGHIQAQLLNFGNAVLHSIPDSRQRSKDQDKIRAMKDSLYRDPKTLETVISGFRYIVSFGNAVLHSIPDSRQRSKDQDKIRAMKDSLYRDPKTLETVISGFRYIVSTVFMAMNHEMSAVGITVELNFDPKRALSLLRNATERDDITEEQSNYMLREAFFANPLDATVIETILLFELDESGGVKAFAKEYGLYDPIYKRYQETLRQTHAKDIKALQEISYDHPVDGFCKAVAICDKLASDGLVVSEYLLDAIGKCMRGYLSESDINTVTTALCEAGDSLGQELVEKAVTMIITR